MAKSEKRDEIVRATMELIAEFGFHDAPIAVIAARANVGAGTIYRYFANKDVLINEIYLEIEERLMAHILEGYRSERPVRERFLHLGVGVLSYFIRNPAEFHYFEQFHISPYGGAFRRERLLERTEYRDVFMVLFQDGTAQQVVKNLPLMMLFSLLFGPLFTVAREHLLGFVPLDDQLIETVVTTCWDAIRQ
ncbi:TetR/AcrR family transcriptional regulator [Oryzomonas sagensis]|uniref:TetR/AcrR family transcriptional regulator n=1 Tax=Oryzomonas sagensis TaxID=2603857 RepID=A0ABQ6TQA5_9BACT|nr:TetR/AcrR family transcriptional regulator [Oryzomonas sagensis]KAB0671211.1 TetR/AcrR family transcriptional regulator [Oryzomonas sagensis]